MKTWLEEEGIPSPTGIGHRFDNKRIKRKLMRITLGVLIWTRILFEMYFIWTYLIWYTQIKYCPKLNSEVKFC